MGSRERRYGCGLALGTACGLALGCSGSITPSPDRAQAGEDSGGRAVGAASGQASHAAGGSALVGGAGGGTGGGAAALGISAELDGEGVVFDQEVQAYNGRAPMIEVSARLVMGARWASLRLMVIPESSSIVPGDYGCADGSVVLYTTPQRTQTSQAPGECAIHVSEAGLLSGQVFSGTFSAKVVGTGPEPSATIMGRGEFRAIVQ
jgi:hypothetical protein